MSDPNTLNPADRQAIAGIARWWWLLLITGALWLIIGGIVLQMDAQSLATVGYLVGFMLIFTGVEQFLVASARFILPTSSGAAVRSRSPSGRIR